ncbi:Ni/Fe-hydrogenase, b-type cytochrome subunit [Rummeliibacillus pycnus]|uniref:Ni/Fe-hydrogenase, b-type cytochrome subunit n=1 Tax=Rummeliibacillus pycnus TaxID=101070 RepID=UPI0037CBEE8F
MANPYHSGENSESVYKNNRPPKIEKVNNDTLKIYVWELPVRIFHWINAAAIFALMITGIYIGDPFFASMLQEEASSFLMGWVRYIHFFSAFLFTVNLLIRLYWTFVGNKYATSNLIRKIFWKDTWETVKFYLFLKNKKPHFVGHNPLAQLSYWAIIGGGSIIMIFTGFYLYVEPQPESFLGWMFTWVPAIFGDSFEIRSWHHLVAWAFMAFVVVHVYLSIREDYLVKNGTMSSIFTGYKTETKHSNEKTEDESMPGEQNDK